MAKFQWEDHKQFISLINMLSLRNGGQLGPNDEEADEGVEVDVDNRWNQPFVGDSKEDELKQHFLDRFAEIMSRNKGGKHVCCVALRQSGDRRLDGDVKISLLIARNVAFKNHDKKFCSTLQELLAAIGASADDEIRDLSEVKKKLWEESIHYNQPRIDHYADSLRDNLKAFKSAGSLDSIPPYSSDPQFPPYGNFEPTTFCDDPGIGPYSADTHDAYMRFAQERILELDNILCTKGRAWRRRLVERTYAIRRMRSLQTLINSCSKTSVRHKLFRDILFLGRLESCLRMFMEAALHIPGLAQLSIILIENLQPCFSFIRITPFGGCDATSRSASEYDHCQEIY